MNQREYRIGPGAASLMLLVVVLSMSALGMLAMMSARSDESLSLRSQDVARQVAELNVSAEQSLARLDAVLADAARTAQGEADYLARVEAALAEAPEAGMTLLEAHRLMDGDERRGAHADMRRGIAGAGRVPALCQSGIPPCDRRGRAGRRGTTV